MFIRAKNLKTNEEVNINSKHIVVFVPANNGSDSSISLSDGHTLVVDLSNRSLRHAIKKANGQISEPVAS